MLIAPQIGPQIIKALLFRQTSPLALVIPQPDDAPLPHEEARGLKLDQPRPAGRQAAQRAQDVLCGPKLVVLRRRPRTQRADDDAAGLKGEAPQRRVGTTAQDKVDKQAAVLKVGPEPRVCQGPLVGERVPHGRRRGAPETHGPPANDGDRRRPIRRVGPQPHAHHQLHDMTLCQNVPGHHGLDGDPALPHDPHPRPRSQERPFHRATPDEPEPPKSPMLGSRRRIPHSFNRGQRERARPKKKGE